MIHVTIRERDASAKATEPITSGSVGLPVRFRFSDDWEGLGRTAVFSGSGQTVDMAVTENGCVVPHEVLRHAGGRLKIGVYGTGENGSRVTPTVWANAGVILPGAEPSEIEPTPATQSLVQQILEAAEAAQEMAQSVRDDADAGAFDGLDGATGPAGRDGTAGLNGSSIWTVAAEDANGGTIRISDLVGRTGLTPAKNDLVLDGDWNIYRVDLVNSSTVSATKFGNVGAGASSVFLAHYGSTTADTIYEASADGKVCILTYMFPGTIYYLTWLGQEAVLGPEGTAFEKAAVFTALNGDEKTETEVVGSHWSSFSTVKYARSASPTFTGTPKAPTAASGTNTTQLATTAFVQQATSGKLDNNLGSSEAGKFLVVGSDGAVTTMTLATWQAGSY